MKRTRRRLAALLAAVLLSMAFPPSAVGGLGTAGPPTAPAAPSAAGSSGSPTPTSDGSEATEFTTVGCQETFTTTEVPAAWARSQVPPNFEVASSPFLPGSDARPMAWFVMVSSHCEEVVYDGPDTEEVVVPDGQRFWYAVAVDPPDAYESDDAVAHFYPLRFVVSDGDAASILSSWDLPAETGSIGLDRPVDESQARTWAMTAENGNVSYRFAAGAGPWFPFGDSLVRIFGAPQDGTVDHAVDVQPQGNTMYSWPNGQAFHLEAPDGPFPTDGLASPSAAANLKRTPSGQAALGGSLVTLPGASGSS